MDCNKCGSWDTKRNKTTNTAQGTKIQYKCRSCGGYFTRMVHQNEQGKYERSKGWIERVLKAKTFVLTAAQNNADADVDFVASLEKYCEHNDAELLIIPIRYKHHNDDEYEYDLMLEPYLIENNFHLHPKLSVMAEIKIVATAVNPLSGLDSLTKGKSLIIGHSQLQLKTLPVQPSDYPVIMTTTGACTEPRYTKTKQGYKAAFNHSKSAIVVELDGDRFHLRNINWDGEGFFDLDHYYTSYSVEKSDSISAIVTGDEHAIFIEPDVANATYHAEDSIVKTLNPTFIVRHDILDSYSISHHHNNRPLTLYKKHVKQMNSIEEELTHTFNHIRNTTPKGAINLIVASNHHDHLTRWLNECDPKKEPQNAKFYHYMMGAYMDAIERGVRFDPFEFWILTNHRKDVDPDILFLGRKESFKIHDIEVSFHGDAGVNGARGNKATFANLPNKTIVGHSHSPSIEKGCYTVGTSTGALEYTSGPSSWLNTHCLIHSNGKRQIVNIIKGEWRRKPKYK